MPKKPSSALKKSSLSPSSSPRKTELLALVLLTCFLAGCAGYRLGPTNGVAAGSRAIQVKLFQNQTYEPRLSEPVATALRRAIQQDGTYRLATRDDADILVDGVIVNFDRSGITYDPRDVLTVRDYELKVTAKFTATEVATGKTIIASTAVGRTTIRSGTDLASAERQAAPLLAEDLARRITSALVDGTW